MKSKTTPYQLRKVLESPFRSNRAVADYLGVHEATYAAQCKKHGVPTVFQHHRRKKTNG